MLPVNDNNLHPNQQDSQPMASLTFISNFLSSSNSSSSTLHLIHNHRPLSFTSTLSLLHSHSSSQKTILELPHKNYKNSRGLSAITKAGPSSTSYIFAFVFPISLLAVTIFTSMRIADELDQKFLEEVQTYSSMGFC